MVYSPEPAMWSAPLALWPVALVVLAQLPSTQTPKERYEWLLAEYTRATKAWSERYDPGGKPTPAEESIVRYQDWPTWTYLPRFMELAEKNPSDASAVDALLWIVDQGQAIGLNDKEYYPFLVRALEQLERAQILDNRPFPKPRWVMRHPSPATEHFLRDILAKNKSRDVRGRACLYLGELLISRAKLAGKPWFEQPKTLFEAFVLGRFDPAVLKYIRETDPQASTVAGEALLERAIDEFGDINWDGPFDARGRPARRQTVGEMAQRELDEIRAPAMSKDAPP
jgi:hypothetical protein